MIIVPTEKRFDSKHAPIMLFCIVIVNILVFFLYQSQDGIKANSAIEIYQNKGYISQEWPLYAEYLEHQEEPEALSTFTKQADNNEYGEIVIAMLLDREFYEFLEARAPSIFTADELSSWNIHRPIIQDQFDSISSVANGLSGKHFKISALFTHQFLHGSFMHLIGNLFFLIFCGFAVEAAIGHWRFLIFYLICGIAGGLSHVAADLNSSTPLIGASGAISGVMAMYLAVFRLRKIEFFYWIFFLVGYIRAPALLILPFYIGKELLDYYLNPDSNVAFLAHAGGFVCGALLIGISLLFKLQIVDDEYIEEDTSVDPYQEKLALVYQDIENMQFGHAKDKVNALIDEKGASFELENIRYNLLKLNKSEAFYKSLIKLLSFERLLPKQIQNLEQIWKDNIAITDKLNDKTLLKLAFQFSTLDNTESVEAVTDKLLARNSKEPDLALLTQKLSSMFERLGNQAKQNKFAQLSQTLKNGGGHATL